MLSRFFSAFKLMTLDFSLQFSWKALQKCISHYQVNIAPCTFLNYEQTFYLKIVNCSLNSSKIWEILELRFLPRIPPISTFSSFKNWSEVWKNSRTIIKRSTKASYRLKIRSSWNSQFFGLVCLCFFFLLTPTARISSSRPMKLMSYVCHSVIC